jgi:2-C-methyl-D-erythritol 4-phosphate cytidylyltransferase
MPRFAVILPAAGSSLRFGGGRRSKLIEDLHGIAVIARAVLRFVQRPDTHYIYLAVPNDGLIPQVQEPNSATDLSSRAGEIWSALQRVPEIASKLGGQVNLVPGGRHRAESVRAALRVVPADIEWIAIHDAARPLLSQDLIDRTLAAALEHGAAAPALPVALTIKRATGPLPAPALETLARDQLWALQTPQIIRRETLVRAFEQCPIPLERVTDDLQLLELIGEPAWLVSGEETNLKITTPNDLRLAELILRRLEGG